MGPDTSFNLVRVVKMHARVQERPSHIFDVYPNPAMASTPSADALVIPGASVVARTPCTEHITRFNICIYHLHQVHDGVEENEKFVYSALTPCSNRPHMDSLLVSSWPSLPEP